MKIIIVGCGKVGYAIAQQLTQEKSRSIRQKFVGLTTVWVPWRWARMRIWCSLTRTR